MSLDVYLTDKNIKFQVCPHCGREVEKLETQFKNVYSANITHNLGEMADKAGIYKHLWRPEELGIKKARELVNPLSEGLARLKEKPDYFKAFNPENGWGDYDGLVRFVEDYIIACVENPNAEIEISR